MDITEKIIIFIAILIIIMPSLYFSPSVDVKIPENCLDEDYWYNYGEGRTTDNLDIDKLNETINCLREKESAEVQKE